MIDPVDHGFTYLDNAATTWPKPRKVYEAVDECLQRLGANPGRSSYRMSVMAQEIIEETRHVLAGFFNAPRPERVVFTLNCTDSLNIALEGLLKPGDRVAIGPYEHNSVTRPLRRLQSEGVQVEVARGGENYGLDMDHFRELCRGGIDAAVVSHASNVTGRVLPIAEIADLVHESGGILVLDAAQTAGKIGIDLAGLGVDVLAAPGHKGLFGPMGTGILIVAGDLDLEPFRVGGSGFRSEDEFQPDDLPWRLEAGTPNLPGIAGLLAGVRFVQSIGVGKIAAKETGLVFTLAAGLAGIDGVRLFSDPRQPQSGIVSFVMDGYDNALLGVLLDESFKIGVRSGLHCSPAAHRTLGTFPDGTLRASFGYFNEDGDVDRLIAALRELR